MIRYNITGYVDYFAVFGYDSKYVISTKAKKMN